MWFWYLVESAFWLLIMAITWPFMWLGEPIDQYYSWIDLDGALRSRQE
jgi:hypothetical protein